MKNYLKKIATKSYAPKSEWNLLRIFLVFIFVLSGSSEAYANEHVIFQNWAVDLSAETVEAYTANDSKSSLGLFCGGATCVFYLNANLNCQPGTKNAVLVNSPSVSSAINMQCTIVGGHYFEILDAFDVVLTALKTGETVGFATALQGGAFAVTRFSLNGAMPAIQKALEDAARRHAPKSGDPAQSLQPGFKDITL